MKAIKYLGPGHIEVADVARPAPKAGEVLVEMRAASICNQVDVRAYNGVQTTYPLELGAPGQEGAGVVAEVGDGVDGFKVGDPVAMVGKKMYAEYSVRQPEELAPLKGATSLVEAAPLGLAGCVIAGVKKAGDLRKHSVIVTGLGPAGLFLVQVAAIAGAKEIIALDIKPKHFELARSLGATTTALANDRGIINTCKGTPADFGIDCSGSPHAVGLLYGMCTTVIAFGSVKETVKIDIPTRRSVTLLNGCLTEEERRAGLAEAVKLFLRKKLHTRPIISQTMRLEEYALAMQKVRRAEVLKLVLTR